MKFQSPHSFLYTDHNLFFFLHLCLVAPVLFIILPLEKINFSKRLSNVSVLGILVYKKVIDALIPLVIYTLSLQMLLFSRLLHIFLLIQKIKRPYQSFQFKPFQSQFHLRLLVSILDDLNLLLSLLIQFVFLKTLIQIHKAILRLITRSNVFCFGQALIR